MRTVLLLCLAFFGLLPCQAAFVARATPLLSLPQASNAGGLHSFALVHNKINIVRKSHQSTSSDSNKQISPSSLQNYHLIWSKKTPQKIVLTALSLSLVLRFVPQKRMQLGGIPWIQNTVLFNAILPTLSSACCWIQLALNMLLPAVGCAGFNTYLGPVRPFFLGLMLHLTILTKNYTKATTMLLRWTLALLPEILHLWNGSNLRLQTWRSSHRLEDQRHWNESGKGKGRVVSVYLNCPTMGCVACINKVDSSLGKKATMLPEISPVEGVPVAQSWLLDGDEKGGKAKITFVVDSESITSSSNDHHGAGDGAEEEVDPKLISSLMKAVEGAGFPCTVDEIQLSSVQ